jgi:hypothetical protein
MAYQGGQQGSVLAGFLWMIVLSILLFWLPIVGPLIAGIVGGRVAGSPGNAFVAAILPAIIVAVGVVVVGTFFLVPFLGVLAGATLFVAIVLHTLPLIVGALLGGALAP